MRFDFSLAAAGCSGGRHDPTEKFYLVAANVKLQYWQTAATGLVAAARQMGVQAENGGSGYIRPSGRARRFPLCCGEEARGNSSRGADPAVLGPEIDSAIAQGIPVVTMDSDAPASKRLLFIGTNNEAAGEMGAKAAVKAMGGKGKVIVYTMPGQPNLEERLHGYKDAFADNHIEIAQTVDVKGDPRIAFDTTNEIIVQNKVKPDGFICLEAEACKEVADVLDRNKVTGKVIVAMDTNKGTLDWIDKGLVNATIAQKPWTMAFYGAKVLDDLHHYKPQSLALNWAEDTQAPIPSFIDTGATLITKSNLAAFQTEGSSSN